ncbi:MAG: hypothetical protein BWY51_00385 [Parcubacteria group bacterium ADurb.Bin316]|nr:MAG: hypothetical protein BWY51_00385 [Parcubacteria group bacterium ADurb.Bin316]HOZ56416.1 hypothetical protein [bacterium]
MNKLLNFYYLAKQSIGQQLSIALSDLFIKVYLAIAVLLNILIWIGAKYIAVAIGTNQIALHYSVGFGIDYYGDTVKIFIIPLLGLLVVLLNFVLYVLVSGYRDRNFIAHILFTSSIVSNIILLIAIISVYIINF